MYRVMKRDGSVADFEISKISAAIGKAFAALEKNSHPSVIDMLALRVTASFEPKIQDDMITVEQIQDCVEQVLSEAGYADVAKAYILYRKQREKVRNVNSALLNYKDLVDNYLKINDWRVKENSTVTYSVLSYGVSAIILAAYSLLRGDSFVGYTPTTWLAFLGLALICTIGGHFVFNVLLKDVPASFVTMSILGEPIGTCILAYFLLHESIAPQQLLGIVVIMAGMAVFFILPNRKK